MKVLFLQNIKGSARMGDIKDVSDGYARNYLLPRNLARLATATATKYAEELKQKQAHLHAASESESRALADKLNGLILEIAQEANEEGVLYGSVDAEMIASELKSQHQLTVSDDQIELATPLKTVGEHTVTIELQPGINAAITVKVIAK